MLKYFLHFSGLEKVLTHYTLSWLVLKHVKWIHVHCNQSHVRKCIQENIWYWK